MREYSFIAISDSSCRLHREGCLDFMKIVSRTLLQILLLIIMINFTRNARVFHDGIKELILAFVIANNENYDLYK